MAVDLFFNPDLVRQLAACGITQHRRPGAGGFALDGRRSPARTREAVTSVIAVRGDVTITGPRQPSTARTTTVSEPLAEECTRLRRSNQLLTDEVARLRAEVERLTSGSTPTRQREQDLDDSAKRFALLELDL